MSIANGAFGKSAQGAFIKSPQGARGFATGGDPFLSIEINQADTGQIEIEIVEYGDIDGAYGADPNEDFPVFLYSGGVLWDIVEQMDGVGVSAADPFFTSGPGLPHGIQDDFPSPNGSTSHTWNQTNDASVAIPEFDKIEIRTAGGSVLKTFSDFQYYHWEDVVLDPGEPRVLLLQAFCWSDVADNGSFCATTSENQKLVARWRREDLGGGDWEIFVGLGSIRAYASGGACALWTGTVAHDFIFEDSVGGEQTVSISHFLGANEFNIDHKLCSGGFWPTSGGSDFDAANSGGFTTQGQATVSFEPIKLLRIESGLGFTFSTPILPYTIQHPPP